MPQDLRYAFRMLSKHPAFTAIAVFALALGIGADTAIFSVVDAVMLRPLPYRSPDELLILRERTPDWPTGMSIAYLNFADWRAQNNVFQQMAAFQYNGLNLTGMGEAERVQAMNVSADMFPLTGANPVMGRAFTPSDDKAGATPVVILTHAFWEDHFHKDPAVLGRSITLDGVPRTIVGVMAAGFRFPPSNVQNRLFLPIGRDGGSIQNRGSHPGIQVMARLKPGVSEQAAHAAMNTIAARLAAQYPDTNRDHSIYMDTAQHYFVRNVRTIMLVILTAVGFVLLIACANVANLLLARAASRAHEISIRAAVGASRLRIVRQMMTESLLLGLIGGGLGLLLASWGVKEISLYLPPDIPRLGEIAIDNRILAFTLLLSLATSMIFGIFPALQIARQDPQNALREGGSLRATGDRERQRARSALMMAEVALSLVLLAGAGLMIKSFENIATASTGLNPSNVLTFAVDLPSTKYVTDADRVNFFKKFENRIREIPGVKHAGLVMPLPLGGNDWEESVTWEGRTMRNSTDYLVTDIVHCTPDYFPAMGVEILKGRAFTERDTAEAPFVAIVDERFVSQNFPREDPIGKRIRFGGRTPQWRQIVGIARHVKNYGVDQESRMETYVPLAQRATSYGVMVVRTTGDPAAMTTPVRRALSELDPNQPLFRVATMEAVLEDTRATKRAAMLLLAAFAATALLLAAIGLYGVISYAVTQRTREIGIRIALGAEKGSVLSLLFRQGARILAAGLAVGLAASLLLAQFLRSLLFGISATDPFTFGAVIVILSAVALLATWIPARRATRVDPIVALRYE